jgi:myo-inositol-1(or 4)-monophosphatase
MTKRQLKEIIDNVTQIALKATPKIELYQKKLHKLNVSSKVAKGMVSNADIEVEKFLISHLKKLYPEFNFLAEEMSYANKSDCREEMIKVKDMEYCWAIDPIDGTSNFLNGFDYFAISIGLLHYGKPILGVVVRPMTGEIFYAGEGLGSFWKKSIEHRATKLPVRKRSVKKLKDSILVTGFASEKGVVFDEEFRKFRLMMSKTRGIRRLGSAALDLCYVAYGLWDGFWEKGLAPWDVAAAGIICSEAGLKVTDYNKQAFDPFAETIVAAPKGLYFEMIKGLK